MMNPIFQIIYVALDIYSLLVFIYVIIGLLKAFEVLNTYNKFVNTVEKMLSDIIEPILNRIRKFLPYFRNVDLSPVVLLLAIYFVQYSMEYYLR